MEKEPKPKKSLMIFGFLIISSAIIGAMLYLLSTKNPELHDKAMWAFAVTSVFAVSFQMYYKEFQIGQVSWMKIPFAFRFIWWFIFVTNTFNFTQQAITTFIF